MVTHFVPHEVRNASLYIMLDFFFHRVNTVWLAGCSYVPYVHLRFVTFCYVLLRRNKISQHCSIWWHSCHRPQPSLTSVMSTDKPNNLQTCTSWHSLKDTILPSVRTFLVPLSPLLHLLSFFFDLLFFFVIFSFTSLLFMYVNDICKFATCNTGITTCLNLLLTVLQIAVTGVRILAGKTNLYLLQNIQTSSRAHPVCCLMVTGVLYRGQSG